MIAYQISPEKETPLPDGTGRFCVQGPYWAKTGSVIADTLRMFYWRDPWVTIDGVGQARFGFIPHCVGRHPPIDRPPGPAAVPVHPLGHEGDPAGGHVVESAYQHYLYRVHRI